MRHLRAAVANAPLHNHVDRETNWHHVAGRHADLLCSCQHPPAAHDKKGRARVGHHEPGRGPAAGWPRLRRIGPPRAQTTWERLDCCRHPRCGGDNGQRVSCAALQRVMAGACGRKGRAARTKQQGLNAVGIPARGDARFHPSNSCGVVTVPATTVPTLKQETLPEKPLPSAPG